MTISEHILHGTFVYQIYIYLFVFYLVKYQQMLSYILALLLETQLSC